MERVGCLCLDVVCVVVLDLVWCLVIWFTWFVFCCLLVVCLVAGGLVTLFDVFYGGVLGFG